MTRDRRVVGTVQRVALGTLLLLAACKKQADGGTCGADAEVLGAEGGFGARAWALDWTTDASTGVSVSQRIEAVVPDDIVGLGLTVDAGAARTGLGLVTLDGRVVVDAFQGRSFGEAEAAARTARGRTAAVDTWTGTGDTFFGTPTPGWGVAPFYLYPQVAGALVLPINDVTRPTGGCLSVVAVAVDPPDGGTLHVTTKRSPVTDHTLDVDLVVVDGAGISETQLADAVGVMKQLYGAGGALQIGDVRTWSVSLPDGALVGSSNAALAGLRGAHLEGANPWAMRFFFVADFKGEAGTLGISAGIPGALGVVDTAGSGVVVSVQGHLLAGGGLDTRTLGETMAHEAGHLMGLFHTTESYGDSFDVLDDTPECDAKTHDKDRDGTVYAEECTDADGRNFMFWVSGGFRQDELSAGQADVLDRSPVSVRAEEGR